MRMGKYTKTKPQMSWMETIEQRSYSGVQEDGGGKRRWQNGNLSRGDQETEKDAAISRKLSTRTMRTYEESKVPGEVRHSQKAAALSERLIERKNPSETNETSKGQAYGQVSLDAREDNAEKKAAGRFTEDTAVWRDELQMRRSMRQPGEDGRDAEGEDHEVQGRG